MVAVGIVMALCNSLGWAQSYYSLQHTNWLPFPFLPFEVTVLDLGDDIFAYDDLSVDYDQLQAARQQALMNVTYRYVETLADHGLAEVCQRHPALLGGINVMNGKLTHKAVAEAHGMKWEVPKPG